MHNAHITKEERELILHGLDLIIVYENTGNLDAPNIKLALQLKNKLTPPEERPIDPNKPVIHPLYF